MRIANVFGFTAALTLLCLAAAPAWAGEGPPELPDCETPNDGSGPCKRDFRLSFSEGDLTFVSGGDLPVTMPLGINVGSSCIPADEDDPNSFFMILRVFSDGVSDSPPNSS